MKLAPRLLALALVAMAVSASADPVILDRSPDAFPGAALQPGSFGNWTNQRAGQHFADSFSFANAVTLTGMSIYSGNFLGQVGDTVTIDLYADNGGLPGLLMSEFQESISVVDSVGATTTPEITQKFVSFTVTMALSANTTYWIGMSGGGPSSYLDIMQLGLSGSGAPDDGSMAQFNGNSYTYSSTGLGDLSMRLYGTSSVDDSAATTVLIGLALAGLVALRRKLA